MSGGLARARSAFRALGGPPAPDAPRAPLRVLGHPPAPWRSSALGLAASVPWCCVLPALVASLGLGASVAGHWMRGATPVFLGLSAAFLLRAHYLLRVKRHGSAAARLATNLLTLTAAALWAWRLSG